jgi:pectate lyase
MPLLLSTYLSLMVSAHSFSYSALINMSIGLFFDNFDEHVPPESPDGWTVLSGTWQTAADETIVYEQTDTSVARSGSVAGNTAWTNYTFKVRVKFVSAGAEATRGALLGFRFQDGANYYYLGMGEDTDELRLYRRIDGTDTQIGSSVSITLVQNQWYNVTISIEGQTINVWVDGVQYFVNQESGGDLTSGKIGLGTRYYHCRFDDVEVFPI